MTGPGGEEEALALHDGERRGAVGELVLDLAGEDEAPMPVGAPFVASGAALVLDDRPALTECLGGARVNVGLIVGPGDRREVEPAAAQAACSSR